MKVAVVTGTVGNDCLEKCLQSVQDQTYDNLTHYVFLDGEQHYDKIHPQLFKVSGKKPIKTISLDENTGSNGWLAHRAYAASSFLVNADIICYLDEDNWYEPNHVEGIFKTIEKGNDWAYSLRKIYDKEGNYVCEDNCESLGKWPVYFNNSVHHIDTSSFGVRLRVAVNIGQSWYGQWIADRQFFSALRQFFPKYECTRQYSLCYRLGGNSNSVKAEFFEQGNKVTQEKYKGDWPWLKDEVSSVNVGPGIKILT